ncbi:MAG TPA: tetratricopeptide repeat protein [Opitutaceae bacterium]|jgi:tetratricopeptide (TPR) repeat protein
MNPPVVRPGAGVGGPGQPACRLAGALACLAVAAGLVALVAASRPYAWRGPAAAEPYNLMVDGFRRGHTWMAKDAPPALLAAGNPYDFGTYRQFLGPPWGLIDLSYFKGHLYAYFGAAPAVLLFWPYRALTGHYAHEAAAVLAFSLVGLLAACALLEDVRRRCFPRVGPLGAACGVVLAGSLSTLPVLLARPGLFEVSISCGFMLLMLCLCALWRSRHSAGRAAWIAAASLAYGLAVGSRPTLLFGAFILFLPALGAARRGPAWAWLRDFLAALVPIGLVGLGLAAYNHARFGSALQFGHDYQLSGNDVYGRSSFAWHFLRDNVRLYFLAAPRWHPGFPFIWEPVAPALSADHLPIEFFFGVLPAFPALLLAAAAPRRAPAGALWALFVALALPICLYAGATSRYLADFVPALALLAVAGFWRLAGPAAGAVRWPVRALFAFSVANAWLLAAALCGFYRGAEDGARLLAQGRLAEAEGAYARVCGIDPDFRGQADMALGVASLSKGFVPKAAAYLVRAAAEEPRLEAAQYNLGIAYLYEGRRADAAKALGRALAIDPSDAQARGILRQLEAPRAGK